eukprot:CAMPEP_0197555242 /NCGR_PEP_ID=MMETSP1320-20131121/12971_1 /TAXON_ID=91990 /ORGANISM="Bolidomonas sp., Strain RCC2347" /LENGTH=120 /DNA_ID=CAMNT_0043116237 /DNA_START=48 /DNA_END=407 /DNA_ORIENTATION=-
MRAQPPQHQDEKGAQRAEYERVFLPPRHPVRAESVPLVDREARHLLGDLEERVLGRAARRAAVVRREGAEGGAGGKLTADLRGPERLDVLVVAVLALMYAFRPLDEDFLRFQLGDARRRR